MRLTLPLTTKSVSASPGDVTVDHDARGTYLVIRIVADGRIQVEGRQADINAFLEQCARLGIVVDLAYLSWCG